jgi:alpha-mannosidase
VEQAFNLDHWPFWFPNLDGYSSKSYVSNILKGEQSIINIGHGHLKLSFSTDQGTAINYVNGRTSMTEPVKQTFSYYSAYNGSNDKEPLIPQNSGAYVFRPNGTFPINPEGQVPLTVIHGPLVDEVHQQINPWISQVPKFLVCSPCSLDCLHLQTLGIYLKFKLFCGFLNSV